jgi:DNA-binding domain
MTSQRTEHSLGLLRMFGNSVNCCSLSARRIWMAARGYCFSLLSPQINHFIHPWHFYFWTESINMNTDENKWGSTAAVEATSAKSSNEKPESTDKEDDSDVELEGMDLEGVDVDEDGDAVGEDDIGVVEMGDLQESPTVADEADDKHAKEDHDEMEEARREQMELMAAEKNKISKPALEEKASVAEKLEFLLAQSEVFAHFLAGTVAATEKKKGKGSRGKMNRMTEAEEDAQMMKSAQSKRTVIRLDQQPSILSEHCKMHAYQLEGLNWLIKLHCSGINGILADEVRSRMMAEIVLSGLVFRPST